MRSLLLFLAVGTAFSQPLNPEDLAAGRKEFSARCAACHGADGAGGERGPSIVRRYRSRDRSEADWRDLIRNGIPSAGMPGFDLSDRIIGQLATYVRSLREGAAEQFPLVALRLRDGRTIRGYLKNESNYDLQLQGADGRLYLVGRDEVSDVTREDKALPPALSDQIPGGPTFAELLDPKPGEWPTYHGRYSGNRHSPLRQIDAQNVATLMPRWIFPVAGAQRLEVTPVVLDGVMYVTAANEAYALDARNGRQIWHYRRPLTKGLVGDAAGAINRGVALLGNRVFLVTDNAHLLALHRITGKLLWDVEMADSRQNYGATSAPLVVKDLVVSGTSGGDEGVRGFVAAYKASTGERAWRFWIVPAPGEPLAKTWVGKAIEHGCSTAWFTGTYDPTADLLYWTTGNPCPDYNGDERKGDNLYSDSVLALKPETGELRWHYQYTPHDLHDWDSVQTPMLVDAEFQGRRRALLAQGNRNGFFYVLDRTNGELLLARPFVEKMNWASGIGPDGRPKVLPGSDPTPQGVKVCPAVEGATNWMSTAFNPDTGLFYLMALEKCSIFTKTAALWQPGKSFYGGDTREVREEAGRKFLRALDLQTGKIVWEYPQAGTARSWGGVLSTAGGVVFFGEDSGSLAAVDAKTGNPLWHFQTNHIWKASPMTYMADGRQYVAVAAGPNILAFGLP